MIRFFGMRQAPGEDVTPAGGVRRRSRLAPLDEYGLPENPFAPPPDTQLPSARRRADVQQEPEPAPAPVMQTQAVRPAAQMEAPGAQREVPRARREVPQSQREVPQAPQAQMEVPQAPQAQRRRAYQPPQLEGPQFQAPVSPEIPDWLVAARQNNPPMNNRPQGPRVQAAPPPPQEETAPARRRPAAPYQRTGAGYTPGAQSPYNAGAQQSQTPYRRPAPARQPHASFAPAADQQAQQGYSRAAAYQQASAGYQYENGYRQPSYQPEEAQEQVIRRRPAPQADDWQVETEETEERFELPEWVTKVPWLGIAAFACVFAAVIIWITGMTYDKQRVQVLDERAAQEQALVEKYPLRFRDTIGMKADSYNLSPAFVAAIVMNESSFRPEVSASEGVEGDYARGLMQLRPSTAEWIHGKIGLANVFRAEDLFTPEANLEYGCWYLNYLSELFYGDPVLVAAAYHAGQGEVRNWLNTAAYSPDGRTVAIEKIPFSDTRRYVTRVMDAYAAYLRIYYGG